MGSLHNTFSTAKPARQPMRERSGAPVDCFGVNWDIEDSDFPAMFADAMQQAQPTLDNPALQPIGGLQNLMLRDSEVELVRECFRWLYNEDGGDISKRRGRAELFADQINGGSAACSRA